MTGTPLTFAEIFGLPLAVDLRTAARALGIHQETAYRLIRIGRFPCPVVRVGNRYRIPTAFLLDTLGVDQIPVYAEDLETGVRYAAREMEEPG
ncbi:helix-turn-helix domain-containing protein [Nonomuraea fuscirosea]|jgi:excisionase family DNA binding protein|uniref:helix-turn-helix domain-containing protein n=1 Tax=Nonomuraea fuscirosea TaxID=1291556 RepID=UPI0033E3B1F1